MTEYNSTTKTSEGVRRQFNEELPLALLNNLELYSEVRLDKIRDQHIMYSRSVCRKIAEGKSLDYVVRTLSVEIPANRMDIALTRQLINYFLEEDGQSIRFDEFLNVIDGETILQSSGLNSELIEAYELNETKVRDEAHQYVADRYAPVFIDGEVHEYLLAVLKGDVIFEDLDAAIIASKINAILEARNAPVRLDKYLNQTTL